MPKSDNQKLKLLYTADYLMRETDANDKGEMLHGVLLWQIKDYLKEKGIDAEEHSMAVNNLKPKRYILKRALCANNTNIVTFRA